MKAELHAVFAVKSPKNQQSNWQMSLLIYTTWLIRIACFICLVGWNLIPDMSLLHHISCEYNLFTDISTRIIVLTTMLTEGCDCLWKSVNLSLIISLRGISFCQTQFVKMSHLVGTLKDITVPKYSRAFFFLLSYRNIR